MASISMTLCGRANSVCKKTGTRPVILNVQHNGSRLPITLPVRCKPKHWIVTTTASGKKSGKLASGWGIDSKQKTVLLQTAHSVAEQLVRDYAEDLPKYSCKELKQFIAKAINAEYAKKRQHEDQAPISTIQLFPALRELKAWFNSDERKQWAMAKHVSTIHNCLQNGRWAALAPEITLSELKPDLIEGIYNYMLFVQELDFDYVVSYIKHLSSCLNYIIRLHNAKHKGNNKLCISQEENHFIGVGEGKFSVPQRSKTNKQKAIEHSLLERILCAPVAANTSAYHFRNMAVLMFNLNGMDCVDALTLRLKDIRGNYAHDGSFLPTAVEYVRTKQNSPHKTKTPTALTVEANPTARAILAFYVQDRDLQSSEYVFPILNPAISKTRKGWLQRNDMVARFNRNFKEMASIVGLGHLSPSSKQIRYSFGTACKRQHVNIYVIQEMYGHSSIAQTEMYLSAMNKEDLREANAKVEISVPLDPATPRLVVNNATKIMPLALVKPVRVTPTAIINSGAKNAQSQSRVA